MTQPYVRPDEAPKSPGKFTKDSGTPNVKLNLPMVIPTVVVSVLKVALPFLLILGIGGMLYMGYKNGRVFNGFGMMLPGVVLFSVIGMMIRGSNSNGPDGAEIRSKRADYHRYIDGERKAAIEVERNYYLDAQFHYPDPATGLLDLVNDKSRRMWARVPGDEHFGRTRLGRGVVASPVTFDTIEIGNPKELDPLGTTVLHDYLTAHVDLWNVPRPVSLTREACWRFTGDMDVARASARAWVMELAALHSPEHVQIVALTDESRGPEWDLLKWLPHHRRRDAGMEHLMTYRSVSDLRFGLGENFSSRAGQIEQRNILDGGASLAAVAGQTAGTRATAAAGPGLVVVIVDTDSVDWKTLATDSGREAVCFLDLTNGPVPQMIRNKASRTLRYRSDGRIDRATDTEPDEFAFAGTADQLSVEMAETIARRIAQWRPGLKSQRLAGASADPALNSLRLPDLLGIEDAATWNPADTQKRAQDERNIMRTAVGRNMDTGRVFEMDMKEAGKNGDGPHMGSAGTTGFGKSEHLRAKVLGYAAQHTTDDYTFVGADFKGNATFQGLEGIRHVTTVVNNLDTNPDRMERFLQWLQGQVDYRQGLIDLAGPTVSNIFEYRAARARGALGTDGNPLPPMPFLHLGFDEMEEAKSQYPNLVLYQAVLGRVGRSLGICVDVTSQKLDPGTLGKLGTHLRGRSNFFMGDPSEYRELMGSFSAPGLPERPGVGYYASGKDPKESVQRIEFAYVGARYRPPVVKKSDEQKRSAAGYHRPTLVSTMPDAVASRIESKYPQPAPEDDGDGEKNAPVPEVEDTRSDLEVMVDRLNTCTCCNRWPFPPELVNQPAASDVMSLYAAEGEQIPPMHVPVGVVDKPRDQGAQPPLYLGLDKNVIIAGKSVEDRSAVTVGWILATALYYAPERMQFYGLDYAAGGLMSIRDLKHVGEIVPQGNTYGARRLMSYLRNVIQSRRDEWRAVDMFNVADWRLAMFEGNPMGVKLPKPDGHGEIQVVIDGVEGLVKDIPEMQDVIKFIRDTGPGFGVHLIIGSKGWLSDGAFKIEENIEYKFEMALDNSTTSKMSRAYNESIPAGIPGRGLVAVGGGAARRQIKTSGTERVDPPDAWHVLFVAPAVRIGEGPEGVLEGPAAAASVNGLWPDSETAPKLPVLPDQVSYAQVADAITIPPSPSMVLGIREYDLGPQLWTPESDGHLYVVAGAEAGKSSVLRFLAEQADMDAERLGEAHARDEQRVYIFDNRESLLGACVSADAYVVDKAQVPEKVEEIVGLLQGREVADNIDQAERMRRREIGGKGYEGPKILVFVDNLTDFVIAGLPDPFAPLRPFVANGKKIGLHLIVSRMGDLSAVVAMNNMQAELINSGAPVFIMSCPDTVVYQKVKASKLPAGRGMLFSRDGAVMPVQTPLVNPLDPVDRRSDRGH